MIKALFIDLGNVLVRFDHMASAGKIASRTGVSPQELYTLFFDSPLIIEHDRGLLTTRQFYDRLKREIGLPAGYEEFLAAWNNIFTEDRETTALVKRLLPRRPCYLISNTNQAHFEHIRRMIPMLDDLHGRILSYEVGCLKPHPAIYHRGLELAGARAEEVFYVDDRPDLIEAAGGMGFQTHLFTGAEALARELQARGILNGAASSA